VNARSEWTKKEGVKREKDASRSETNGTGSQQLKESKKVLDRAKEEQGPHSKRTPLRDKSVKKKDVWTGADEKMSSASIAVGRGVGRPSGNGVRLDERRTMKGEKKGTGPRRSFTIGKSFKRRASGDSKGDERERAYVPHRGLTQKKKGAGGKKEEGKSRGLGATTPME